MTVSAREKVEDLFERYLSTRRLSKNSIFAYRYDLKFLLDWCDAEQLDPLEATTQALDLHFHNFGLTGSSDLRV